MPLQGKVSFDFVFPPPPFVPIVDVLCVYSRGGVEALEGHPRLFHVQQCCGRFFRLALCGLCEERPHIH